MASKKIKISTNPVADKYSTSQEKTIEFSSPNGGGLINFYMDDSGKLIVSVYRTDKTVEVLTRDNIK